MINDVFDFVAVCGIEVVKASLDNGVIEMKDYKSGKTFGYGELTEIVRCCDFVKEFGYTNLVKSIEKNNGDTDFSKFLLKMQTHKLRVVQSLLISADKLGLLHKFKHAFGD